MRNKVTHIIMSIFLFGIVIIIAGCSSPNDNSKSSSKNENIDIIKSVLEHQFTGPDLKLIELLDSPDNNSPDGNPELESYLEKMYGPYFTDGIDNKYVLAFGTFYHTSAYDNGYELKTGNINIVQDKTNTDAFDFNVDVLVYEKGTDELKFTADVSGRAYIYEDNKIAKIDILDYGKLDEALVGEN